MQYSPISYRIGSCYKKIFPSPYFLFLPAYCMYPINTSPLHLIKHLHSEDIFFPCLFSLIFFFLSSTVFLWHTIFYVSGASVDGWGESVFHSTGDTVHKFLLFSYEQKTAGGLASFVSDLHVNHVLDGHRKDLGPTQLEEDGASYRLMTQVKDEKYTRPQCLS